MIKKALVLSAISLSLISTTAFSQNLAVVNGKPIPASWSDNLVKGFVNHGEKDTPQLRQEVKNILVTREVLVQEAEKQNLASTDAVKEKMEIAKRIALVESLRDDYLKKNPVTEQEIKAEYDRIITNLGDKGYHVQHIVVKDEAEAKNIINQLNKGASFEKLAKEKSIDQASAARGGDADWVVFPPNSPFSDAMKTLKKGQITKTPVKTPVGYAIVKLIDVRKLTPPTLDQSKPKIKSELEEKKWGAYTNSLVKQARIE